MSTTSIAGCKGAEGIVVATLYTVCNGELYKSAASPG
jgi:hypothetical protein